MDNGRHSITVRAVNETSLLRLLAQVRDGAVAPEAAASELRALPFADLGFAVVDHHRALRQGVPEVIFGEGKTTEHVVAVAREITSHGDNLLVTRIGPECARALTEAIPSFTYSALGRVGTCVVQPIESLAGARVAVVSAGTSDAFVADECSVTLRMQGVEHELVRDVGVAGLHRILARRATLAAADVVIVIAGMEGALPSVVGGLVAAPVIAVPTSIGYGSAFGGLAALLGMLNSCASGVTVCNIDNGFGAAFAAGRMLRARAGAKRS